MPLFDLVCSTCGRKAEVLVQDPRDMICPTCLSDMDKLPTSASFKIKGYRASSGYGQKFVDTYAKTYDGREHGYSFTSNRGGTVDRNQGDGA